MSATDERIVVELRASDPRLQSWRDLYALLLARFTPQARSFSIVAEQPKTGVALPENLSRLIAPLGATTRAETTAGFLVEARYPLPEDLSLLPDSLDAFRFVLWGTDNWLLRSHSWGISIELSTTSSGWEAILEEVSVREIPRPSAAVRPFRKTPLATRRGWTVRKRDVGILFASLVGLSSVLALATNDAEWLFVGLAPMFEPLVFIPLREPLALNRIDGRYIVPDDDPVNRQIQRRLVWGSVALIAMAVALPLAWLVGRHSKAWVPIFAAIATAGVVVTMMIRQAHRLLKPFDRYS